MWATIFLIEFGLVTSSFIGNGFTPYFFSNLAANFLHFSKFLSANTTLPPAWQKPSAYSEPNNPAAPVITITRLEKSNTFRIFIILSLI